MEIRKSLTITKYLLKNYVINPFVKKFKKALLSIAVIGLIMGVVVFAPITLLDHEANKTEGQPFKESFREILLRLGLNKYKLVDILSSLLTLSPLLMVITGKAAIRVIEEAEYELLLAQPLDMSTYVLGRSFMELAQMTLMSLPYFGFVPLISQISGGNWGKAFLFPPVLLTIIAYFSVISTLVNVIRISFMEKEWLMKFTCLAYLLIAAFHSILTLRPSPLLKLPFRYLAEAAIYCATISEDLQGVLIRWELSLGILVLLLLLTVKLAGRVPAEYVRPISELMKEARSKAFKTGASLYSADPEEALFRYVFSFDVLTLTHLRNLLIVLAVSGGSGLVFLHVAPKLGFDPRNASFITTFIIPLMVSEMASFLVGQAIAKDLSAMWMFRVYALELKPLASGLLLKHSMYFSEAFLTIALFDAIVREDPRLLLEPLIVLPITIFTSFVLLVVTTYLASKRKIVKQMPTGLYMFEDIALLVVTVIVILTYFSATLLFKEVLIPNFTFQTASLSILLSIIISWALHKASSRILADVTRLYDLAS
ncbi:MAG: hypothetical protein DRJ43_05560 [Thermoprotei archaeon]|nr:MAG: hypothetical protein DRJ43_05560 [Thermoprotei archaeon]